jgi:hypothetical protein
MTFKELQHLSAAQFLTDDHRAGGIDTVDLEYRLGEFNPDRDSIRSGWRMVWWTLR